MSRCHRSRGPALSARGAAALRLCYVVFLTVLAAGLAVPAAGAALSRSTERLLAQVKAPEAQLRETSDTSSLGSRFHRLRQFVDGLPVLGSEVVVTDAPGTRGDLVVDGTHSRLSRPDRVRIGRRFAVLAALRSVHQTLRVRPRAELGILPRGRKSVPVWRVLLPLAHPDRTFEALVDARAGTVIRLRDLGQHATGTARLFDPNPVVQQGSRLGLADNDDADSALLTSLRVPVTLERLNGDGTCLTGRWVKPRIPSGAACAAGGDFTSVTRSDPRFEAAMAYFHIDRTRAYLQTLGFGSLLDRQVAVDVDNWESTYYDSFSGSVVLGVLNVDAGEDADAIVHEYGHAIQDAQVPGFPKGPEAGAMAEGSADYLAAAVSANQRPGSPFNACIGEWWEVGAGDPATMPCLRRTDTDLTTAQVRAGTVCNAEVHCAGQVWSGALWQIRTALGGAAADRLVIQAQYSLTPDADFHEGSQALISADQALYGGAHVAFLRSLLAGRGLLDLERLDDTPESASSLALPGEATGDLTSGRDLHDVYAVQLTAGHGVLFTLNSGARDFDLRLYRPSAVNLTDSNSVVASSAARGTSAEAISYVPAVSGVYFVDVAQVAGSGPYAVEASTDSDGDYRPDSADNCPSVSNTNQRDGDGDGTGDVCDRFPLDAADDADGDRHGADVDNCPLVANADQADWNHDGLGDACDAVSGVTLDRVLVRGRVVKLRGSLHPPELAASAWRVQVQRRFCNGRRCRFRLLFVVRGIPDGQPGTVERSIRLPRPGRYRFRAVLVDPNYTFAASAYTAIKLR